MFNINPGWEEKGYPGDYESSLGHNLVGPQEYPIVNDDQDFYPPAQALPPKPPIVATKQILTEQIKLFIQSFYQSIKDNNLPEVQNIYEIGCPKLTEQFFDKKKWPSADDIASEVNHDATFLILYKEIYYRHAYAHVQSELSLEERFDSYYNYCELFNLILNADQPIALELPNQWLWDIIDEFIYQFQSFTNFRCKVTKIGEDILEVLRTNPKIWNVHSVLNVLHCLIDKSNINEQLAAFATGGVTDTVAGTFGNHSLYKMLGFFSLIGLCRLHCLLGDYYQALRVLEKIDISRQEIYCRIPTCHITTAYYVGFSYMMMRRYQDAIRTLSSILVYLQRARSSIQQRSTATVMEYVNKQADQMYHLLCICLTLHPMRVDDIVQQNLKDRYQDKLLRLQKMEAQEFENSFQFSCPKFLSPIAPNYDLPGRNYLMEPYQQQLSIFLNEIDQMITVPQLRSYLKLYTTLPLAKLADFVAQDETKLSTNLMCFKHKLQNMVWSPAGNATSVLNSLGGLGGELQSGSDVDFCIDGDMIHIADTKVSRPFGEFFIRHIAKLQEMSKSIASLDAQVLQQQQQQPQQQLGSSSQKYHYNQSGSKKMATVVES